MATVEKKSKGKNIESIYPLSPMQQGMLFHTLYAPETGVYFQQLSCTLQGNLNIAAFEQAWQRVVERHPALRTAFVWENPKQSFQVVCKLVNIPWAHHDWRSLSPSEQQDALEAFLQADRDRGFELKQVPLMRCTLIKVADNTYKFIWSHHHLLIDGWSLTTIVQEVFAFYDTFNKGENLHLKASRPYGDYISWLKKQDNSQAELYWQETLKGFTVPTSLTVEIPLTKRQQHSNYNTQQIKIAEIGQIQTFAKQNKLTLNNLIQGAWALLLSRYSGETDIVFGATVSGRPPELLGVESMVGLFINTLPVRITIPEDIEVLSWLKELQAQQVESEQYSYSPLVEIQSWSEIPKGMSLFESIVVFENYPVEASIQEQDNNLNISHIRCIEQTNYPLTLLAVPGSELSINITYDSSRFEAATINRMLGHLQTLLIGMINQPHQRLWKLPLLTKTELWQLLEEPHKTPTKQFPNQCIHELFELQVEQTPEAIAVIFENQQLTYEQLNIKANQLAHYLRSLGVSADTLVGICVERSLEMIVGILGILKAGGAYVPLDPNYPQERLSFTLSDSQIKILLTQQQLLSTLPKNQTKVICIDSDWETIAQHHPHNPPIFTTSANLAYIIYTSGSTGKPKGVLINHANVVRLFTATEDWFHFHQQDVWTMFHSYAFDFSVWEIWGALIKGGRLVIVPYWVSRSPQDFYQLLSTQQVTVLNQTPSAFRQLIQAEAIAKTSANLALRWVIFGGEALELQSLKPWFERHGDKMPKLVNMYGITETTVHVTYRPITNADLTSNAGSVIGCPIPDLQVYVLDKNRQLLPMGVTGEMYVGGAGLARGYFNREELTSNVFVTHPFSDDPNARLYKTGDLARYLGNGELEYLGRIDNQVKVRGFRIELGEIEAAISQHPLIQATVVIARVENNGDKRLVAYLVINQQQTLSINDLRQFLSSKLPQYMIPAAFVFLDTLPLTSNGKIDRRALPAPEPVWESEKSYVAPRTAIEGILTQIWTEVLGVEQVGIYDNFFELGGDSILSLQIIARANLAGVYLSPKQLFEHQAIAQLAAVAGTITQIQAQQGLVTGLVALTPIQHWFFEQNQLEPHHYNQSVLLSVPSYLKPELLKRVLQQLLLHHDALRLQFTKSGGSWQQVNADFEETVPLNVVDLSTMSQTEQLKALEDAGNQLQASLNLSTGPIMAAALFELGRQTNRLLLTIHHLAVDGVSWRILLDDLQAGYEQICRGERIQLPPKTTSFQYWAQRLSEYAQSDILKDELTYWLNQSRKPVLPIPVDYIDGSNIVTSARVVSVSLNTTQTQALLQEVPRAYNTQINDVLLTALAQVLGKWIGSQLVLLNLEGHGREDIFKDVDLSRTVGWFTTIFPVLLELGATDNLGNILKSIKEQLRQIPHKGIGYGVLRYLHQDAEIRQQLQAFTPAQISFNYLGQFDQALSTTADFQLTTESAGAVQSLNNFRSHLLDINAIIVNGQMQIDWTYSSNIHQQSTIEILANEFIQALQALIAHCLSPEVGGYTPSDFPLAKLTQAQLDTELGKIKYENLEDIYPLSPMQQGMLFHSLYAPESGVYFERLSCTFQGKLEVENFEQAWQQVIAKYSVFRTGFIWENHHQPLQVVYRQVKLPLVIDDWQGLSVIEQQDKLNIFLESEARRGFELSLAPLMRLSLIQLDANVYQFIWSHHHLLLDGWSLSLVLKEVFDCYEAICQGRNFRHEPSSVYRNYIAWLQQQDLAQAKVFWQQKLQGFSAPTLLTVDKPLTDRQQESNYSRQQIYLPQSLTAILQAFARQHQLTLNNLVQGAWALLLSRYSGEEDVVFGATVSGRPPELIGVESIVGLFINTLPVRVLVPSKGELLPWLKELQAQHLECEQYSYTPLVEIQGWSEIPRGMPLFESIVVFENYPVDAAVQQHNGNLQISDIRGSEQTNYPLTVSVVPGSQLSLNISYDTSRFESATITRMLGHLQTLLEGIATKPEQHLCQLPLLTKSEQNQLLWEWNNTQKDYPQDRCIHQLFEQQVELTPDAVAVVFQDHQLTYGQLNTRANQLAHYLQSLGVKPDVLVGIYVERSLEMVVGLLAILKAGGAYVPLDPHYPSERLGYMLSDSQVSLLLTQQRLVEKLPDHQAQVICLDSDWNLICQLSAENPITGVQAANLAYVIYTSGSTGQPKGVLIPHQGLLNLVFWHQRSFEITPHDRATQLAGTAFDASVWELWPYLSGGASIYLVPQEILSSLEGLRDWLIRQQVTIAFLPTPLAEALLSVEWSDDCALRILLTGGDRLHHYPSASIPFPLVNNYGPTENTVVTTSGLVLADEQQHTLPGIGRPIDNTQVYILDGNLQLLPIGVPGELHIGGDSLARGYLHRSELTQEKFIPHPFAATDGQRLYKTGDLVRYLADGNIEYLGRIDNQVKIRGFRIELGEVENALSQHPSIQQVTVLVREDVPGDKRLVAYVVLQQDHVLTVSYLRQCLRETLPEYMIPAAFIFLEALPLTSNGKVDRRALPIPDFRQELEVSFMAPRTPNEEILANIWADVLKVNRVGIYDNFFELGGDSILSLQIIARANQAGLQLSPKQLFEHPTIVELMTVVDTTKKIQAEQNLVTGLVPLTPIQHWAFEQNLPDLHHYNQSVLLSVPSDLKLEILESVFKQLLLHHDALRLRFTRDDGAWLQVNTGVEETISLSVIDLSTISSQEQRATLENIGNELQASLNLSTGPMLRAALFKFGTKEPSKLLAIAHHFVVDGVSWRILLEDLLNVYQQLSLGETIQLPPKTTSFQYWAQRLSEYAQSDALLAESTYWLNVAAKQIPPIPLDYEHGVNTVAVATTVSVSLTGTDTQLLLQEVPKAYNTQINDVLLTALVQVIGKWTGSNLLLLDLEGHGREDLFADVDLSRTVGWFTTIFPVLLELESTENLAQILKSVKEQLRQIPHKGIGYGLLRYLCLDEQISQKFQSYPTAQISFNYLGQFDQTFGTSADFQLTTESAGAAQSLNNCRSHLLDINGMIVNGQLQIDWTYSSDIHQHATIDDLAQEFIQKLRSLIVHCLSPDAFGYTPSDFPLAKLTQTQLDNQFSKTKYQNLEDIYPLSPMQQGMLFHSLYTPESGAYFEQLSFTLKGNLEISAFEQAWQQTISRHSIFRTGFIWENDDQPLQIVYRQVTLPLEIDDWRAYSASEQQEKLNIFREFEQQQSFQLSFAPLMRLILIQLDINTYQFILSYHHLLLDGWSLSLVFKEVFELYEAICQGRHLRLEPIPAYRQYIAWLKQQDLAVAKVFWQQKLQGFTAPTPLIVDVLLANQPQDLGYAEQKIYLSESTTNLLQTFAKQHQLTLNNLVQGAWSILLSRYSGETDVVFGVTVSGRPPELMGVESMVGLFINTLPARVTLSPEMELLSWLKQLQVQQVEYEQYSYTPLVDIQTWSEIPRGMPLFESIVVFENYPVDTAVQQHNGSLQVSDFQAGMEITDYPLTVTAVPGLQLFLSINYDTSRFDSVMITRMLGHLQTLLAEMVTNQQQHLGQLPLLTLDEQQQLLWEWNATQKDYPQDRCIHELLELQAQLTPDAVAVVFETQQLTYGQLNARANQLAQYLRHLGVETELLVGVCLERSLEIVVAILGILKAGGAYLPLDPNYPLDRLGYMLSDSHVSLLLTQQQLIAKLPQHTAHILCLDSDWHLIAQSGNSNLVNFTSANNLAYVIYTSGSTGQPKGVMVTHQSLVNAYFAWENAYQLQSLCTSHLQMASFSFDVFSGDVVRALCSGGKLVICPRELLLDPEKLYQLIQTQRIDCAEFVPAVLRNLIQYLDRTQQNLSGMKLLIVGSDSWSMQEYQQFRRFLGNQTRLINSYGVSEATIDSSYFETETVNLFSNKLVPIGRPFANTQLYILDQYLQPVPIGVSGELYIGGAGVSRGYLNRPELTQEKFIPHPFSPQQGARLYKTGDLARYLSNGNIEYLERSDHQVKIRGFRIELGEIEALLTQHPQVQVVTVIVREDVPGDKRLVAYIVIKQEPAPTIDQLRQFLNSKLPHYMIPAAFVFLEALPLTPNGKIDRRALKPPESRPQLEVSFVAATTSIEQQLASIWADVLRVEQVGIHDNFFELGGDSILSLQIISRTNQAGLQLSPKQLFEHPTIAELATVAGTAKKIQAQQGLVTGTVPLTPIQHWFFHQNQPQPHHYNQSVVLTVPSELKVELLNRVVQELLLHHDALRMRFVWNDGSWLQENSAFAENVSLTVVDLSDISPTQQAIALENTANQVQASLNLSTGELMRVVLFVFGDNQPSRLLIVIHHLVVDGVSWRILLADLQTGYQQLLNGEAIAFPAKTTSFQYWAQRLCEYAQSTALVSELNYWLTTSVANVTLLPVDYPRSQISNTIASSGYLSLSLNAEETRKLLQEAPAAYNTQINDVLLTALVQSFEKWTGSDSLLVDLEGHGREEILEDVDLSRTVGWFTSVFPIHLQLGNEKHPGNALKLVKEQLRRLPMQGIGYGILRYLSQYADQLNNLSSAEVSFNYLGQFDRESSATETWTFAQESGGSEYDSQQHRSYLLEISGLVMNGEMQINWEYSEKVHHRSTVEHLAESFMESLRNLIQHCLSPNVGGFTPSDFPKAGLNQEELDDLLADIN
ncbi:amino acid adenylation domain-containing protein [Calothrix brevissima NIES-22]|nr:amino acid adenylation domain-containing protein [Calothrix brevissima NIES-22]